MTGPRADRSLSRAWLLVRGLSLAGAVLAAFLAPGLPSPTPRSRPQAAAPAPTSEPPAARARAARPAPPLAVAGNEPHPITPEHLRISEQHQLFDRVEAAIAEADLPRARALLREHRERFPEPDAWTDLRRGWEVIADCLEHAGPEATLHAEAFIREESGSSLRRRVRRVCLERAD